MAITQEEWTKRHRQVLKNLVTNNRPLQIAASTAMKDMGIRIFIDGLKTDGSQIGKYNTTKPMYVNPKTAAGAATGNKKLNIQGLTPPTGKHGDKVFKNSKPHVTTYVKSYADFRKRVGKQVAKVDLVLSGDLQSDFSNGNAKNPTPKKVNPNEYIVTLKRQESRDKREGAEKRFGGSIFHHTKEEIAKFVKIADQELRSEFAKAGI